MKRNAINLNRCRILELNNWFYQISDLDILESITKIDPNRCCPLDELDEYFDWWNEQTMEEKERIYTVYHFDDLKQNNSEKK
jgi:hypothetical protein